MLGFAGRALDLDFVYLDPSDSPPARVVGPVLRYPFDDEHGLRELAAAADIITYEFENVPVSALRDLGDVTSYPPARALELAQDRRLEKELFASLAIPVPPYRLVESERDLRSAAAALGLPVVVKTRRLGYDGKGQAVVRADEDIVRAWRQLGDVPLIAEQWVDFDCEVSIIGARSVSGEIAVYPLTENRHENGILSISRAPADAAGLSGLAGRYLRALLADLEYVGVLALELFVVGTQLFANEFAPRVHNSGHWTIEGAVTSQFENHLRAILDMPLGDTRAVGHAGMLNLIGAVPPGIERLECDGFYLHDYGKAPRPGRKLGHVTVIAGDVARRDAGIATLGSLIHA